MFKVMIVQVSISGRYDIGFQSKTKQSGCRICKQISLSQRQIVADIKISGLRHGPPPLYTKIKE